ncbi:MAG: DUF3298 domain-containing protein [Bacilli bacterium]|nr:DUF3298 domain-containing protein [Bacilli bacterium]
MIKHLIEINETYKYKLNVAYPLSSFNNVNKAILSMINKALKEFIQVSKRTTQTNMYYSLYITYKEYEYNGITSYIFKFSEFTGGAHPNNYLQSIRFDKDGNIITIDTLLGKDNDILNKLSAVTRKDLLSRKDFKDDNVMSMVLDGTRASKDNFKNFAFTNEGLLVFFDYYQVAPYYYGIQKVLISYNLLN